MATYKVSLPAIFAADHWNRMLPSGDLIRQSKLLWTFNCTEDQLHEWLSDAIYYADIEWLGGNTGELSNLQQSARKVIPRVRKVLSDIEELRELQEQLFQQAHQAQEEAP